ncbi:hypothetical protein V8E54_003732 [Elaphomyces granulatus]
MEKFIIEILDSPLKCLVETEYIGPDNEHIVAWPGDYVLVWAWSYEDHTVATALACSMENSSIGKIPVDCLDFEMSEPHPFGIYVAKYDYKATHNPKAPLPWDLSWGAGYHIKVYMWGDPETKKRGFGLNLATGEVGTF